jgi:hypothetical protein
MQVHEFYGKYANTKIPARTVPIPTTESVKKYYGWITKEMTLSGIYQEVDRLEQIMLPLRLQQQYLIEMAEKQIMENQA